jgi:hypothetical protein
MAGGERRRHRARLTACVLAAAIAVAVAVLVQGGPTRTTTLRPMPPGTSSGPDAPTTGPTVTPSAPPATGPAAQPPPPTEVFGASVNGIFLNYRTYTRPEIDAQLQALHATGATVARCDAPWEAAEPTAPVGGVHRYDWRVDDLIASSLAAHRLKWLPIIDYSAPWAQSIPGQDHSSPQAASDYGAYAGAVAARYGQGGSFWRAHPELPAEPIDTLEIWNEPDQAEFWAPSPSASKYAELYLSARDAITAVDPAARVIVGGLTDPQTFLPALLVARPDLRGHIDGVAIHPYGSNPESILARVRSARHVVRALGLGAVPLYVTEFGWTIDPPGALHYLPERLRPWYIAVTVALLGHLDCGIAASVVYTWVTPERDPGNPEDWFGIHPRGGGSNQATTAFTAGLQQATTPWPFLPPCTGG